MAPSVTLPASSLCSENEARRACGIGTADSLTDDLTDALREAIIDASTEIELRLFGRHFVTRGQLTEYHTVDAIDPSVIRPRQRPLIAVVSVQEGYWSATGWTVSETLTVTEDYLVESSDDVVILRRVSSGAESSWASGPQKIKLVYTAGYATTSVVPSFVRYKAARLAALRFGNLRRGQPGASSITDGMGTVTRFAPADLLRTEWDELMAFANFKTTAVA